MSHSADRTLPSVGHGTASQEQFAELLGSAGVQALVDVRIAPGSGKFPHFGKDLLADCLPAAEQAVAIMCSETVWWRCITGTGTRGRAVLVPPGATRRSASGPALVPGR